MYRVINSFFYVGVSPLLSQGNVVMPVTALFQSAEQNQCKQDTSIYTCITWYYMVMSCEVKHSNDSCLGTCADAIVEATQEVCVSS